MPNRRVPLWSPKVARVIGLPPAVGLRISLAASAPAQEAALLNRPASRLQGSAGFPAAYPSAPAQEGR